MAKTSFDSFRDLDLTRDEIDRIGEALKDKEFRKLFSDYVTEVNDPENRRIFEKELTQLERERGVDVTFINPQPGYVIKTSVNGSKKAFVNVCSSERIGQPSSKPTYQDGAKGLQWTLPHSLAPPREDIDNKKIVCQVFDVVFHPDTLHLALKNPAFKNMVNKTACDAVENNFDCKLDMKNLKFPNLKFKGIARPTIIRKQIDNHQNKSTSEESEIMNKIFEQMPKVAEAPKAKPSRPRKNSTEEKSKYTTPKYEIKHRSHIELENFTYDRSAKMNSAIPKELVVEICLPLLKAATDIDLDVTEKTVQLKSETPAKYKLSITLPYKVQEASGNAKFDKDTKKLIVTLPVKRNTRIINDYAREDSGVESDHGSISPPREKVSTPPPEVEKTAFLDSSIEYTLPEYTCHLCENLIFTLSVKNVHESTIEKIFNDANTALHLKFTSISAGHFPAHYAFYVKLPAHFVNPEATTIETWDNNVVVQIAFTPCNKELTSYLVGVCEDSLEEKSVDGKQLIAPELDVDDDPDDEQHDSEEERQRPTIDRAVTKPQVQKANKIVDTVDLNPEPKTKAIDIMGSYSESSGDDMSCNSYSPKYKGILKRMSVSSRSSVSRSISESSIDDFTWTSSFENCYSVSQDSVIHEEEGEPSTSLKKTVRFNNHVLRQLFRSNSSILGQKKKNLRKNRNKKRANERRHSESEVSEGEKERESKTNSFKKQSSDMDNNNPEESKKDENIFPIDI
ncbi:protein kintoun [Atheta coriaria]|uniref:protein kintoun n=1 Tax=Dalotia coriaria TaxID=877792 RepID=UPI0031F38680